MQPVKETNFLIAVRFISNSCFVDLQYFVNEAIAFIPLTKQLNL